MRKPSEVIINGKTLAKILENHQHWLRRDVGGYEDMRANLKGVDISDTDLRGVNLKYARLDGVSFYKSDLREADLRWASLWDANLSYANLHEAKLSYAEIVRGNLSYANFRDASFVDACLADSVLTNADFECANLSWADLRNCNLCHANFRYCNLWNANLVGAKDVSYIPLRCPSDGAFIGWKRVKDVLIKLEIPADAKRSSATTRKCRCEKAKVLGFYDSLGLNELNITELVNNRYEKCRYIKGEMVYPDYFDDNRWDECSHGIHFFINKQDAINY